MDLESPVQLRPELAVGGLLLLLSFFFYQRYLEGMSAWSKLFQPVQRSFENTASPMDRVLTGTGGCLRACVYAVLGFLALAFALDFMVQDGAAFEYTRLHIGDWIRQVAIWVQAWS